MNFSSVKKLPARSWRILAPAVILFALAACGGEATSAPTVPSTETGTPVTGTTAAPIAAGTPTIAATEVPVTPGPTPVTPATEVPVTPGPTPSPAATEPPSATAVPPATLAPLILELLTPQDGAGVETGALRVLGQTRVDAVVGVNGIPVDVSADGSFTHDISLEEGINLVEVVATDLTGQAATAQAMVFFITTAAGLPFSLFYPPDGLETAEPTIRVFGGTTADAVVGVNGTPVEVNSLGIFSTTVTLEDWPNFIEVIATDIRGNVRFQTVAVFYLP